MKKIILLMFLFLLSGCTVNYELTVSEDLSVTENFSILNDASYYDMLGDVNSVYKQVVDLGMKETNYVTYEYVNQNDLYGGKVNYHYNSLIDFKERAKSYKKLYDDIEVNKNGSIITINSIGNLKLAPAISSTNENIDQLLIKDFYFSIKLPFKVVSSNADRVDNQNNTYYWDIDNNVTGEKSFQIQFDTSKRFVSFKTIISQIDYTFVFIIVIILIGLLVYSNIKKKNEKNNKI